MVATTGSNSSTGCPDVRASHNATPPSAQSAQAVFNDLIRHEAFDAFADAFDAHNNIQRALAEANGKAFKSTLTLQLPSGWTTNAPAAMERVFARVRVDRLEVLRAPDDATKTNAETGAMFAVPPASEPVCSAIVALLKTGVRELWLQVALEADVRVANAIAASPHLRWVALEDPIQGRAMDPSVAESHRCLISQGLLRCPTLEDVALLHHELVMTLQLALAFPPKSPPPWTSMALRFSETGAVNAKPFLRQLDNFLEKFPALTALHLSVLGLDVKSAFCALDIVLAACLTSGLAHFTCDLGKLPPSAVSDMTDLYAVKPERFVLSKRLQAAFQDPALPLQSLALRGFPWPAGELRALVGAMASNTTLLHLDLSGSYMELSATELLTWVLLSNSTLQTCRLPDDPRHYYFMNAAHEVVAVVQENRGPRAHEDAADLSDSVLVALPAEEAGDPRPMPFTPAAPQALLNQRHRGELHASETTSNATSTATNTDTAGA